jgi:hypothetical protein
VNSCSTCRHWKVSDEWDVQPGGLRTCMAVREIWRLEDDVPEAIREGKYGYDGDGDPTTALYTAATEDLIAKAKAVVRDASNYVAELLTRPDFGCVLWSSPNNE